MRPDPDAASLTPEQRFRELAGLLARALLRLPRRIVSAKPAKDSDSEKPPESGPSSLAIPGETRLSVHTSSPSRVPEKGAPHGELCSILSRQLLALLLIHPFVS